MPQITPGLFLEPGSVTRCARATALTIALLLGVAPGAVGQTQAQADDQERTAAAGDTATTSDAGISDIDRRYNAVAVAALAPPRIDGVLDDAAWADATLIDDFVQARPDEGEPASQRTVVRVMYDSENLYIAAYCYDTEPDSIVASVLRRDQSHNNNDSFTVTLDTYHDHRNGFYFETNAVGAKYDAQITGEGGTSLLSRLRGDGFNEDWDAVWYASARVVDDGWVVEMAIPFWSLRFEPDQVEAWGVNFRRTIRRRGEAAYWAPVPRQFDVTRVSLAGMLTGLQELSRPRNLQVKPFVIGDVAQSPTGDLDADGSLRHRTDTGGDVGLDVKWGVTPNITVDLTANTDFSQVEADDEQINLTRFSLFFPEKREFFLENAGLFDFGTGAGITRAGNAGSVVGFHSRTIGISPSNEEIPLFGGGRVTGKAGPWSVGMLSMQSEDFGGFASNNYSVLRTRRDLGARSTVGMLYTNRQASGDDYNRALGLDGRWALNSETTVDAWWMRTWTPGLDGSQWAGQVRLDWGNPTWQFDGGIVQIGEDFNPEMGFVNRTDLRTYSGTVHWTPYPETDWIRNHSPHMSTTYTTDTDGRLLSRFLHFDWDTFLSRGDKLSVAHNRRFEHLDLPFEIAADVVIPPGAYHYDEVNLELQSDGSRPVSGSVNYTWGTFWSGDRREIRAALGVRSGARFSMRVSWSRNDVELPQGDFVTDLVSTRVGLDFTPRLSLAALLQYNSQADQLLSNVRVNFIHTEGADIFLVYNERRLAEDSDLIDRAIVLKATHLLRF